MVHVPYFSILPWTSVPPISPWTSGTADGRRKDELEHFVRRRRFLLPSGSGEEMRKCSNAFKKGESVSSRGGDDRRRRRWKRGRFWGL